MGPLGDRSPLGEMGLLGEMRSLDFTWTLWSAMASYATIEN